jgi:hypothetical protein
MLTQKKITGFHTHLIGLSETETLSPTHDSTIGYDPPRHRFCRRAISKLLCRCYHHLRHKVGLTIKLNAIDKATYDEYRTKLYNPSAKIAGKKLTTEVTFPPGRTSKISPMD